MPDEPAKPISNSTTGCYLPHPTPIPEDRQTSNTACNFNRFLQDIIQITHKAPLQPCGKYAKGLRGLHNNKPQVSMSLNVDILTKLHVALHDKGWAGDIDKRRSGKELFRIIAEFLETLSEEQAKLVVDLLRSYDRYTMDMYPSMVNNAFKDINFDRHAKAKTAYFIPLMPRSDFEQGKIKSGLSFMYQIPYLPFLEIAPPLAKLEIKTLLNYAQYEQYKGRQERSCFVFVDDFIGTGDTALKTLHEFINEYDIDINDVYVLSLVSMGTGIERLMSYGVDVGAAVVKYKGITESDGFNGRVAETLSLMVEMEQKISVPPKYQLGYGRSEGLVSMIRTPNNTFPIFWYDNKKTRDVPFPRF